MKKHLKVKGKKITINTYSGKEYFSLTDMLKVKDGSFFISDWLRNRNTMEFLSLWEQLNNPQFNYGESAIIRNKAGLHNFKISVKEWVKKTNAIGLHATAGRYGGTYAHKDIAMEFASWISVEFKLYLIKEFQRLKEEEHERLQLGWNLRRELSKINYTIHTDAIEQNLIPPKITPADAKAIYTSEADLLNKALLGMTAREWHDKHPDKKGTIRDYANVTQLVILSNLESLNAELIKEKRSKEERLAKLNKTAIDQMTSLINNKQMKRLKSQNLKYEHLN